MMAWIHWFMAPANFYRFAELTKPWFFAVALLLFAMGLFSGLVLAPADYQQGDAFRIIYVHVPSAFLSLGIYAAMTVCAVIYLVWRVKLADVLIVAMTAVGAWLTFLALVTGAIWGKPMWGTWWIWDARLTSELILLFIYLAIIALRHAIDNPESAAKAVAVLVVIGCIDLPIIHYSVYWWNTLHQGATIAKFAKPSIAAEMLYPLLMMLTAFVCCCIGIVLTRAQALLLSREPKARWAQGVMR